MFDFHSFMLFKQLKSMRLLDLVFSCQLIDGICFIMLSNEYLKFISFMQLLVLYLCILFSSLRQRRLLCGPH